MRKTDLNRYNLNYVGWLISYRSIFGDSNEMLELAAENLINSKKLLPADLVKETHLEDYKTVAELLKDEKQFAKIALKFCNNSIINPTVLFNEDTNTLIYSSNVNNSAFLPNLLILDYVINLARLSMRFSNKHLISTDINVIGDAFFFDDDPFVRLANSFLKKAFKNIYFLIEKSPKILEN